jgi:uncharacterized surface protein with fasciclin (FAS1) repeats
MPLSSTETARKTVGREPGEVALMTRRGLLLLLMLAVIASAGFAVAACGDDEETTTTTAAPTTTTEMAMMDIVDTAVAAGDFTTLASLLETAGLVETLKGPGPFTVFAPTDDAFAAVPQETLDALAADPEGALTQVLTYHVVPGKVMAADVTDGLEAETVEGSMVTFTVSDGGVMINDANIVQTDIEASNGVIHVIDAVILPPGM